MAYCLNTYIAENMRNAREGDQAPEKAREGCQNIWIDLHAMLKRKGIVLQMQISCK